MDGHKDNVPHRSGHSDRQKILKQMRIKDNLRLRKIGSRSMVVREVEGEVNMTDVFTLNATASDIWSAFAGKDFTGEDLVGYLIDNYDLHIDESECIVHYSPVSSNIMPEIRVIAR